MFGRDNRKLSGRFGPVLLAFTVLIVTQMAPGSAKAPKRPVPIDVKAAFGSDCEDLLLREVRKAEEEILIAIYSVTRRSLTSELSKAVERGVKIEVKYDAKSCEWPGMKQAIGYMRKRGVSCTPIEFSSDYGKMHHKFTVIDGKRVLTGSANYSTTAFTDSYENMVLINDQDLAQEFKEQFLKIESKLKPGKKK